MQYCQTSMRAALSCTLLAAQSQSSGQRPCGVQQPKQQQAWAKLSGQAGKCRG